MSKPRLAVTATVTDCETWLEDWLAHNMQIFDQAFVWVDDPAELAFARTFGSDRVSILPGQQIAHPSRLTRILARQDANADAALGFSAMAGIEWLVHLDVDELFVPSDSGLWDTDARQLVFRNHECVPVWDSARPIRTVTRFKQNGARAFMLYANGKAAVRPGAPPVSVRASGPHRFAGADATDSAGAAVLHYACATYAAWRTKYTRLGAFSDNWLERAERPITLDFHLRSRDLVTEACRTGDWTACEAFFRQLTRPVGAAGLIDIQRDAGGRVRLL